MLKHEWFESLITTVDPSSVFVEIGSDRGENSTECLRDLAKKYSVNFLTVDIDDKTDVLSHCWKNFYQNIRDPSWPKTVSCIDELPEETQAECIDVHGWELFKKREIDRANDLYKQPHIKFYQAIGSDWARDYHKNIRKPISLLYLDNFDYIWDVDNVAPEFKKQMTEYQEQWNIDMNNQQCQVEHLTQMIHLEPFLAQQAIIGLDDTYLYNDCWIGKSGPVVVYLLALGYKIELINKTTVFLKKL